MTDVLVITGPVDAQQLGVAELAPGSTVVHPYVAGTEIGSEAFRQRTASWLRGRPLRKAIEAQGIEIDRLGVVWFSAGHGSVRAMQHAGTQPGDADVWLCLDGLYVGWGTAAKWASTLAEGALRGDTVVCATASSSTPGQYADGISAWREVVESLSVPAVEDTADVEALGFPHPSGAWGAPGLRVLEYEAIGHGGQVPACRAGAMALWQAVRAGGDVLNQADRPPRGETLVNPVHITVDQPVWPYVAIGVGALLTTYGVVTTTWRSRR